MNHRTPTARDDEPSALLSRLRVIEDQPLEARAEALAQVHDELRASSRPGTRRDRMPDAASDAAGPARRRAGAPRARPVARAGGRGRSTRAGSRSTARRRSRRRCECRRMPCSASVGDDRYVSRAAHKLAAALDAFAVDRGRAARARRRAPRPAASRRCCSSAARAQVIALDVGHGQLAAALRDDDRVSRRRGRQRARSLTARDAGRRIRDRRACRTWWSPTCRSSRSATCCRRSSTTVGLDADFVLLVKPQFEVGRTGIREGIVRDRARAADAVIGVLWAAWDLGLPTAGVISSPVAGQQRESGVSGLAERARRRQSDRMVEGRSTPCSECCAVTSTPTKGPRMSDSTAPHPRRRAHRARRFARGRRRRSAAS